MGGAILHGGRWLHEVEAHRPRMYMRMSHAVQQCLYTTMDYIIV